MRIPLEFKNLYLTLLICLFFKTASSIEITTSYDHQSAAASFEIIINDTTLIQGGEFKISVYADGINSVYNLNTKEYSINLSKKKTLSIPFDHKYVYAILHYNNANISNDELSKILNPYNNLFIFEKDDNLKIYINKNGVLFKGHGSEKCILRQKLDIWGDWLFSGNESGKRNSSDYKIDIRKFFEMKKNILDSQRMLVNKDIYNLTLADLWAVYNLKVVASILNANWEPNKIREEYNKYNHNFNPNYLSESILSTSFLYCDFLFRKELDLKRVLNNVIFDRVKGTKSASTFLSEAITHNYKGLIRDKLIFINYIFSRDELDTITLSRSLSNLDAVLYKNAILNVKFKRKNNAFQFQLPDKSGKIHKLEDYKGKLVVIDFWFTGCHPCMTMAQALKPVINKYKENKDIEFFTISVDSSTEVWLSSLESEKYTSKEEINLIDINGMDSAIIKHYNIVTFPKLLIISKAGEVISLTPPNPRVSSEEFVKFIDKHI